MKWHVTIVGANHFFCDVQSECQQHSNAGDTFLNTSATTTLLQFTTAVLWTGKFVCCGVTKTTHFYSFDHNTTTPKFSACECHILSTTTTTILFIFFNSNSTTTIGPSFLRTTFSGPDVNKFTPTAHTKQVAAFLQPYQTLQSVLQNCCKWSLKIQGMFGVHWQRSDSGSEKQLFIAYCCLFFYHTHAFV